ncbi:hypothetical protein [Pseudorhodobacter sp. E13]|uniref:hypothetical protein n=1 Tax=Pseudorhodobacter sp. E13 TaxID=2487931 RepID=UPI000F8CDE7B|nr:hypothetical protein [Pseudorhodobacter sp. E13]
MADRDDILLEVARMIWRREITIGEFYEALGVDLDDLQRSNTADVVTELSGMFKAWHNPPTE